MKVNMKQPILDYEGNPIKDPGPEGKVQTFRDYAIQALNSQAQDEPVLTAEHKNKVYMEDYSKPF